MTCPCAENGFGLCRSPPLILNLEISLTDVKVSAPEGSAAESDVRQNRSNAGLIDGDYITMSNDGLTTQSGGCKNGTGNDSICIERLG